MPHDTPQHRSLTLARLFADKAAQLSDRQRETIEAGRAATALRQRVEKEFPNLPWPDVLQTTLDRLDGLLDVELGDILATVWDKCVALREYADPTKHPPDEVNMVPLTEHSLTSTHEPYLRVMLGETELGRIDFTLELTLTLVGAVLRIQDGRILGVAAGHCQGDGELTCEGIELFTEQISLELPGAIDFGEGLVIGASTQAAPVH